MNLNSVKKWNLLKSVLYSISKSIQPYAIAKP